MAWRTVGVLKQWEDNGTFRSLDRDWSYFRIKVSEARRPGDIGEKTKYDFSFRIGFLQFTKSV